MRQSFIIEKVPGDEEVEFSAIENSNKVRITVLDADSDTAEVELTLAQAKEARKALDKAIQLAENPYGIYATTIDAGTIKAGDIMRDYYFGATVPRYSFGRYGY